MRDCLQDSTRMLQEPCTCADSPPRCLEVSLLHAAEHVVDDHPVRHARAASLLDGVDAAGSQKGRRRYDPASAQLR